MNIRDKNHLPVSFIFHRREEEKRRLLRAWKTGSTDPYPCLPGRKRRHSLNSVTLTEELRL
jgi:hypothetical protein